MEIVMEYSEAINYGRGVSLLMTYMVAGQSEEECFEQIWAMEQNCIPWHFTHGIDYIVEDKYHEQYIEWKRENHYSGKSDDYEKYKDEIDHEMRMLYPYLYMKKG